MPGLSRVLVAGLVAAAVAPAARAGEPYRDTTHKFAFDPPDGWEAVPAKDVATMNTPARRDDPLTRLAVYRPAGAGGGPGRWKYPLVMVTTIPFHEPDATFKDFEKVLTRVFTMRTADGRTFLREPLAFDEQKKRLIVQCDNADGISEYAGGFVGKEAIIIVSGLVERKKYRDHLPTFVAVVDSFRFEDAAPPPAPEPPYLDRVLKTNLGPAGQTAAIGVGVAVVVLLLGVVFLREKRH